MRVHLQKLILPLLLSLIFPTKVFADTVTLKSGKIIEGKIIQQTNEYIEITTSVGVSVKYYSDEIQTIKLDNPGSINNEST